MGFRHGKATVVSLDGDSFTQYSNSIKFSRSAETHETTPFGKNSKTYAPGLKDGTATIEGIYDDTPSTGPAAVLRPLVGAPAVEMVYQPEGAGSGKPIATVQVLVNSYDEEPSSTDMIKWTAEVQFTDDIADTTGA